MIVRKPSSNLVGDHVWATLDTVQDAACDAHASEMLRAYAHDWRAVRVWRRHHYAAPLPAALPVVAA